MSRIGRKPIVIPAGVEVSVNGHDVTVKGPKGTLNSKIHPLMTVKVENGEILVTRPNDEKEARSLHGLTRTNISNMVEGVVNGFEKKLEVQGVGYRVAKQGKSLVMNLGFSHQVIVDETDDIKIESAPPSLTRARASAMPVSTSSAKRAKPAKANKVRSERQWLISLTRTKPGFVVTAVCAVRSAAPLSAPVWMYSAPPSTSMPRSSMMWPA